MTGESSIASLRVEGDREVRSFYGPRLTSNPRRRRNLRRPIATVVAMAVVLSLAFGGMIALSNKAPQQTELASPLYTTHSPIRITGNANFTAANGVSEGAGTISNPFKISGWTISARTQAGIVVEQTTAYFEIENVNIHDGGITSVGIQLNHVSNATISSSVLMNNSIGIDLLQSSMVIIENNSLWKNVAVGVQVSHSTMVTLEHNILLQNAIVGVTVDNSTMVSVSENAVGQNLLGVSLMHDANCSVNENSFVNNTIALSLQITNDTLVNENLFIKSNGTGIVMLNQCRNNTVSENSFRNTTGLGMLVDISSTKNKVARNNFLNGTTRPQATDDNMMTNVWNDSYPSGGNFWTDYVGVDVMGGPGQNLTTGPDGIGDTPYALGGTGMAADAYPLMRPVMLNLTPIPLFIFQENSSQNMRVDFDASMSYDPNDDMLEYRWDFTNSGTYTAWSPSPKANYTYSLPGNYTATLQVKDPAGHISTQTLTVSVQAVAIPEFGTMLLPVVAGIVVFFVLGRTRRKGQGDDK